MAHEKSVSLPGAESAEASSTTEKLPLERRPMSIQSVVDAIDSPDLTYPKLQRAVLAGLVPFSTLQNGRKLVRICDVFKAMGIQD
jgi:hypothetical protein